MTIKEIDRASEEIGMLICNPNPRAKGFISAGSLAIIAIALREKRERTECDMSVLDFVTNPSHIHSTKKVPLTLTSLSKVKRGWVWVVDKSDDMPYSGWAIVRESKVMYLWDSEYSPIGLVTKDLNDEYYRGWYGIEWFAYNDNPERSE